MPANVELWGAATGSVTGDSASEIVVPTMKPTRWWAVWWPPVVGLLLVLILMEVAARTT